MTNTTEANPLKYCSQCQHGRDITDIYCKACGTKLLLRNPELFPRSFLTWCKEYWTGPTALTILLGAVLIYIIYLTVNNPTEQFARFFVLLGVDIVIFIGILILWVAPYLSGRRELHKTGRVDQGNGTYRI